MVGLKPFEELPSYVRVMDAGLPYADSAFNRASSPLKVLEYLAAGRPAIATDLPAVRSIGEVVEAATGGPAFADAARAHRRRRPTYVIEAPPPPPPVAVGTRPRLASPPSSGWCETVGGPRHPDPLQPAIAGS